MNTIVTLREIADGEFAEFQALAVESYANDNAAAGRWSVGESLGLARAEFERLMPQGAKTPGHQVLAVLDSASGRVVGFVWFAEMARGSQTVAFVYELIIKSQDRRKGYGRAALLATEQAARTAGYSGVALHVFSRNAGAVSLYESVGFQSVSINMQKSFGTNDA